MVFLMKLTSNYANVRSHILIMETMPTLPQAYRILLQEKRHREISHTTSVNEPFAFAADRRFQGNYQRPKSSYQPPHKSVTISNKSKK